MLSTKVEIDLMYLYIVVMQLEARNSIVNILEITLTYTCNSITSSLVFFKLWEAYPFALDGEILIIVYILMKKASEKMLRKKKCTYVYE